MGEDKLVSQLCSTVFEGLVGESNPPLFSQIYFSLCFTIVSSAAFLRSNVQMQISVTSCVHVYVRALL